MFNCDYTVNLPGESIEVLASDFTAKSDNQKDYPVGVRIEIRLDADNPDEAFQKADKWAAAFASTLSFVSNIGVGNPQKELALDVTDSATSRKLLQFFDEPIPVTASVGQVDAEAFSTIFGKIAEEKMPYSDRVGRAISFYNKGLRETHPMDRFTSFWLGFETLNQPLKEILSAPDTIVRCRKCGLETKENSLTGVKELMSQELPDGKAVFGKMRGLRVKVFHSTEPLSPLIPEIQKDADTLQELLRKTIFRFLDVRYEGKVVRPPITNIVPIVYGVECSINGDTSVPSLKTGGEYTHLVISGGSSQTIVNDDGSVTKKPTLTYAPVGIPEGAQLIFTGSRIYGEKGKIKNAGVVNVKVSDTKP